MAFLVHINVETEITGTRSYVGWYRSTWLRQVTTIRLTFTAHFLTLPPASISYLNVQAPYPNSGSQNVQSSLYGLFRAKANRHPQAVQDQQTWDLRGLLPRAPDTTDILSILSMAKRYQRPTFCLLLNF